MKHLSACSARLKQNNNSPSSWNNNNPVTTSLNIFKRWIAVLAIHLLLQISVWNVAEFHQMSNIEIVSNTSSLINFYGVRRSKCWKIITRVEIERYVAQKACHFFSMKVLLNLPQKMSDLGAHIIEAWATALFANAQLWHCIQIS